MAEGGMIASPSRPDSGIGAASDRSWSSFDEFKYCKISNLVLLPLMIPLMIWLRKLEKGRTCLGPKFKNY